MKRAQRREFRPEADHEHYGRDFGTIFQSKPSTDNKVSGRVCKPDFVAARPLRSEFGSAADLVRSGPASHSFEREAQRSFL